MRPAIIRRAGAWRRDGRTSTSDPVPAGTVAPVRARTVLPVPGGTVVPVPARTVLPVRAGLSFRSRRGLSFPSRRRMSFPLSPGLSFRSRRGLSFLSRRELLVRPRRLPAVIRCRKPPPLCGCRNRRLECGWNLECDWILECGWNADIRLSVRNRVPMVISTAGRNLAGARLARRFLPAIEMTGRDRSGDRPRQASGSQGIETTRNQHHQGSGPGPPAVRITDGITRAGATRRRERQDPNIRLGDHQPGRAPDLEITRPGFFRFRRAPVSEMFRRAPDSSIGWQPHPRHHRPCPG